VRRGEIGEITQAVTEPRNTALKKAASDNSAGRSV
jgi:hypothetical protein